MKRIVLLLSFSVPALAAMYLAAPYYVQARKNADLKAVYARRLAADKPLALDAATEAIFAGADRVETFRLMDPNRDYDEKDMPDPTKPSAKHMEYCQVLAVGPVEGPEFAHALRTALLKMPSSGDTLTPVPDLTPPDGFGSDIGFRVWKGKAHADIYIGVYTNRGETLSRNAQGKLLMQAESMLDGSRPAFIALIQQAFPQNKQLAELKPEVE